VFHQPKKQKFPFFPQNKKISSFNPQQQQSAMSSSSPLIWFFIPKRSDEAREYLLQECIKDLKIIAKGSYSQVI